MRLHVPARPRRGRHVRRDPHRPLAEALVAVGATSIAVLAVLAGTGTAQPADVATRPVVAQAEVAPHEVRPRTDSRASRSRSAPQLEPDLERAPEPDPLPGCPATVVTTHPNGQLPPDALCVLPGRPDHLLRPDAARAFARLAEAYEEHFGTPLEFTDSYRSLRSQQALARRKPGLAAVPGTSEHGWGLAIDFGGGIEGYATPQHRWMKANAERFGWGQPDWAKDGGEREEPWHWEYLAGARPAAAG